MLTSPADRERASPDDVNKEAGKAIYLVDIITYERRRRQDNPAVQAAWEQYQIMLTMARPADD